MKVSPQLRAQHHFHLPNAAFARPWSFRPVPRYGAGLQGRAAGTGDCYIISSFKVANQQRSYSQATADLRASLIGCNDLDRIMRVISGCPGRPGLVSSVDSEQLYEGGRKLG